MEIQWNICEQCGAEYVGDCIFCIEGFIDRMVERIERGEPRAVAFMDFVMGITDEIDLGD